MASSTGSDITRAFVHKRLDRATQHVSSMWLPINPVVLDKIRSGLEEGRYELGYEFLVDDLKADLGLFFFCLRELSHLLAKERKSFSLSKPAELFEVAGRERLKELLSVHPGKVSRHSIDSINPTQAAQVRLALTSATTTEVLAEQSLGNGEFGFLSALLRQLGITLVAWNYPTAFDRALKSVTSTQPLTTVLSSILGFSPELLAASLVRQWGGSSELIYVVGGETALTKDEYERRERIRETVADLSELCRVGEALARANDPEHYPTARADWEEAKGELQKRLGSDGLLQIRERLSDYCEAYRSLRPELFTRAADLSPEKHIHGKVERDLAAHNRYIELCPLGLRKRLKDLYGWLPTSPSVKSSVTQFLNTVLPASGFSGGCVFTLDAGTLDLIPRLRIGEVRLRDLRPIRYEGMPVSEDAILGAFHSPAPLISRTAGRDYAFIVGLLGDKKKLGVLYLELQSGLLDQPDLDYLVIFKAMRQALHDCLGVE